MNILIVGLGSIGTSKARIYDNLGCSVYYYDSKLKDTSFNRLKEDNIGKINFDIIDICSPTYLHVEHLEKFYKIYPKAFFVVEKPICGKQEDLDTFKSLVVMNPTMKILYSENVLFSSVFGPVEAFIQKKKLEIDSVYIEFSKNRLEDVKGGRTVDLELEGFGIDIPHMLTILEKLGVDIEVITFVKTEDMVVGDSNYPRQGSIFLKGHSSSYKDFSVVQSLIGKYYFKEDYFALPDESSNSSYRIININCNDDKSVAIQMEPIAGLDRFISRIMYIERGKVIESIDVPDMNLQELIKHVVDVANGKIPIHSQVTTQHAIKMTETLLKLHEASVHGDQEIHL